MGISQLLWIVCYIQMGVWNRKNKNSILKSKDNTLPTKVYIVKAMVLPVVMYGCESWTIKKAEHWRTYAFNCGVGEKTLESPLDSKEIKPVNPKGNQLCIFTGRTDAEAKVPILWPNDAKDWLEKILMLGKTEGRGSRWQRMRWLDHWLNGHEFEQIPGNSEGQRSLACCSPWGHKELDPTKRLNDN